MHQKHCPICTGPAQLSYDAQPGYQQPARYTIWYCPACTSSFADPMAVDPQIYDQIYRQRQRLPGYARYERYASDVLQEPRPLDYLAESEAVYWAVRAYLGQRADAHRLRLLDIGSGLGYLCYALARQGLHVTGLDISPTAVAQASATYGQRFVCASLAEFGRQQPASIDVAILAEVIEHVTDIDALLAAAAVVLAPGGELLITTPNRAAYPCEVVWHTDPPPIHLWWLAPAAFTRLASRAGFAVRFIDLDGYTRRYTPLVGRQIPAHTATHAPQLDQHGQVLRYEHPLYTLANQVVSRLGLRRPAKHTYLALWRAASLLRATFGPKTLPASTTLCVVLTKPGVNQGATR